MSDYPIAAEALDLEVYVLAGLVAGSHALCDLERDYPRLQQARAIFERSEVSRRLVSLAVLVRQYLGSDDASSTAVGVLIPDVSKPEHRSGLSLREACNKIIHADGVQLSSRPVEQDRTPPVSHTIVLEGAHYGKDWRAELNVLAFLSEVYSRF